MEVQFVWQVSVGAGDPRPCTMCSEMARQASSDLAFAASPARASSTANRLLIFPHDHRTDDP
jgi:hypothetical protein